MRNFKKVVAAGLALLMLALSVNVSFAAETYTDKEAIVVAKVNAAGIMTGTDKGFEPSKSLTRAEAAAIIVRMKGISESAVKTMAGTTLFTDVAASHWASGYVNEASQLGIVKGVSATLFAPDREVTVAEFVTMAVRALGAGQLVDSEGTWPTNYVNFANENDLLKDVTAIYTAVSTRINAATIVANALEADVWEKSSVRSNGEIEWAPKTGKNIRGSVLELTKVKNFYLSEVDFAKHIVTDEVAEPNVEYTVVDDFDLSTLKIGNYYDGYYDKDENKLLGLWKAEDVKSTTKEFTEIKDLTESTIKVVIDGEEVKFDNNARWFYNGELWGPENHARNYANCFGTINYDGKKAYALNIEEYTNVGVVDEIKNERIKFVRVDGKDTNFDNAETLKIDEKSIDDNDLVYFVTKDGKEISITDVEEDDVLFYYTNADKNVFHVNVLTNTVKGAVKSIGSSYITIDGKKYTTTATLSSKPAAKDDVVLYLNAADKVVAWDLVEGTNEYAVIASMEYEKNSKDDVKLYVTLGYSDGTISDKIEVNIKDGDETEVDSIEYFVDAEDLADILYAAITKVTPTLENPIPANVMVDNVVNATAITNGSDYYLYDGRYYTTKAKAIASFEANSGYKATYVSALNKTVKTKASELGQLFQYRMKSNKVIFKKLTNTDKIEICEGLDFRNGTKNYFVVGEGAKVLTDNNTCILTVKANTDDKYKVKVSKVNDEDLETQKNTHFDVTYADINEDGYAKVIVLDLRGEGKLKKGTISDDWYIVIDRSTDIDEDDFDAELTLLDKDGKDVSYLTSEVDTLFSVGLIETVDNELVNIDDEDYGFETVNAYRVDEKDGVIYFVKDDDKTVILNEVLADKVLYIELDADGNYVAGKEVDINDADDADHSVDPTVEVDVTDASKILGYATYTEDGVTEVIAIVFTNEIN